MLAVKIDFIALLTPRVIRICSGISRFVWLNNQNEFVIRIDETS